jgi:4'-phosphopantetheinyl transferase
MTHPAADRSPSELPEHEVHVWIADPGTDGLAQLEARYHGLLDQEERDKYRRFHFDRDRSLYLAAHALTRLALSYYTGMAAHQIRFSRGPNGKPRALLPAPHAAIRHNLSHTAGLVGCALARGRECGLDIETLHPLADPDAIAGMMLSTEEKSHLSRLDAAARDLHLIRLWTLKEAYAKATGQGIGAGLARLSFFIGDDSVTCRSAADGAAVHGWSFHCMAPTGHHALALAVEVAAGPVSVSLKRFPL